MGIFLLKEAKPSHLIFRTVFG